MDSQKNRSRVASETQTGDWQIVNKENNTEFVGYDNIKSEAKILRHRKISKQKKTYYQLVLDKTPFYPEGGGQVGDTGELVNKNESVLIFDTKKENNLIIHFSKTLPDKIKEKFHAKVDVEKRNKTAGNHSATHLLHHALRSVLGPHVEQKGSLVNSKYLRFDFSHFSKVEEEEMEKIEAAIIDEIAKNSRLKEHRDIPLNEAKQMGAMALFGEKYGEKVRVVQFDRSVELCGGIHVNETSEIGMFKIISEGAVAAGIRRIEAITGKEAEKHFIDKAFKLEEVSIALKNPKDIIKTVKDLLLKNQQLNKEIELLNKEKAQGIKESLKKKIIKIKDVNFLGEKINANSSSVKDILFQLKSENENFLGVIGNVDKQKCGISIIISDKLIEEKTWNASKMIKEVSSFINGGGGGQAFYATAGGKNKEGINKAIEEIRKKI